MKDRLSNLKLNRKSIRMPQFGHDLFADLRDRHLLPLVAVLLVAIAAVPFVLSASDPELSDTKGEASIAGGLPESARLSVVADAPALREYTDRLKQLSAKDPFVQHFTAPQVAGAELGVSSDATTTVPTYSGSADFSGSTSSSSSTTDYQAPSPPITYTETFTETYNPDPPSDSGSGNQSPGGNSGSGGNSNGDGDDEDSTQVKVETKLVSYRISARLGAPGKVQPRERIPELTMLPNEKSPLVVFLGVSADAKKALMLVSSDVTAVFGDVRCGFGDESCQLLTIEPGLPVVFTYGPDEKRFQLTVTKIERVTESADRAATPSQPRIGLGHLLGIG